MAILTSKMHFPSLFSIFKKTTQELSVPDTLLIKKLKTLSSQSHLYLFKDVNIFHHADCYHIGLVLIDTYRGIYLFETKEWTYDELKNAEIKKASKQQASANTLSYENTHAIIRQKFNELTHTDGVPIFNFLLMENLNAQEYEHLHDSFKELLPQEKIIFSDASEAEIFKKLQAVTPENSNLPSLDTILGTLLIQYTFLDQKNRPKLANEAQRSFINKKLPSYSELTGLSNSGKSELLLLKAINEILQKNVKKVIIIKPTLLACDLLKKKFLELIEHAIVEIDLDALEILTPQEVQKRERVDLLLCDDADFLDTAFINELTKRQKNKTLLLVKNTLEKEDALLNESYRGSKCKYSFYDTHPHAKALQLIAKFIKNDAKKIFLVAKEETREHLLEDLESFITKTPQTLQSDKHLIYQNSSDIYFCGYEDINQMEVDHIIVMDLFSCSENLLEYAMNRANYSVDILYEQESQQIQNLRSRYEQSSKE